MARYLANFCAPTDQSATGTIISHTKRVAYVPWSADRRRLRGETRLRYYILRAEKTRLFSSMRADFPSTAREYGTGGTGLRISASFIQITCRNGMRTTAATKKTGEVRVSHSDNMNRRNLPKKIVMEAGRRKCPTLRVIHGRSVCAVCAEVAT
ncbi:hypothetical protein PUN28_005196 [Cardiocondyla obscurior]|uniref:Uncharacterized protein n=1 Tax=Cardiocondyla obscurior TaxID=286306 RepID=A0AAW2GJT2_9HYME